MELVGRLWPIANLAKFSNVKDEEVTIIRKGPATKGDSEAYISSWNSTLGKHSDESEDCYETEGRCYGLIVSNTFDREKSVEKFGERYTKRIRRGGKKNRLQVKSLFRHLNVKTIGDHENVNLEDLQTHIPDFKTDVIEDFVHNKADLIFVVVTSNGSLKRPDTVLMDDLEEVSACKDIIYPLGYNDELREIPKIFSFNMCRDSWERDSWVPPEPVKASPAKATSDSARCERSLRHAHLLFTTLPYDVSRRHAVTGAVYISELYRIFKKFAHEKTLWKLLYDCASLLRVHTALLEKYGRTPARQSVGFKNLKFKPRK